MHLQLQLLITVIINEANLPITFSINQLIIYFLKCYSKGQIPQNCTHVSCGTWEIYFGTSHFSFLSVSGLFAAKISTTIQNDVVIQARAANIFGVTVFKMQFNPNNIVFCFFCFLIERGSCIWRLWRLML